MSATLFVVLATASVFLWYLGAAASITLWIRSKLPDPVLSFLDCPACSGFWYGLGLAAVAHARGWLVGPPEIIVVLGASIGFTTPLGAGLLVRALTYRDAVFRHLRSDDDHSGDVTTR